MAIPAFREEDKKVSCNNHRFSRSCHDLRFWKDQENILASCGDCGQVWKYSKEKEHWDILSKAE